MTFLEQKPEDPYEVIAYNDSEHLEDYKGIAKVFADFCNSGLAESANMSFNEFIKLPNWMCDWLIKDWVKLLRRGDKNVLDEALEKEIRANEKKLRQENVDPFRQY